MSLRLSSSRVLTKVGFLSFESEILTSAMTLVVSGWPAAAQLAMACFKSGDFLSSDSLRPDIRQNKSADA